MIMARSVRGRRNSQMIFWFSSGPLPNSADRTLPGAMSAAPKNRDRKAQKKPPMSGPRVSWHVPNLGVQDLRRVNHVRPGARPERAGNFKALMGRQKILQGFVANGPGVDALISVLKI